MVWREKPLARRSSIVDRSTPSRDQWREGVLGVTCSIYEAMVDCIYLGVVTRSRCRSFAFAGRMVFLRRITHTFWGNLGVGKRRRCVCVNRLHRGACK